MIAGTTLQIERARLAGSAVRVKGIGVGLLIVLVAWECTPRAHAHYPAARFDAFTPGRTIRIVQAGYRLCI